MDTETSVFDQIGGATTFEQIVELFYEGVESDPILRPMYPADLAESRRHLALFLIQYFGGSRTYEQERGHPRLRARHIPFRIDEAARDAWLRHMLGAVERAALPEPANTVLMNYLRSTADFLINVPREITLDSS